ncbi:hypothetical protein SAMN05421824_2585 [Hyunsoonleella jejuensis]|uniref:DUF2202 domain-containing protein n=1 Tax=Hyunsoonleella jejuensis TaxID=419940 RepID=A0A1H9JMH3_9FLAO|nr:DUF2202 domain-containing protein [Hyunsoonleella jejuensis]SEQ87938.1 hypothetical protein SAMN05421824_2585 [Hyunsoonleella jejuensis]
MKKLLTKRLVTIIILAVSFTFLNTCSDNNDDMENNGINNDFISETFVEKDKAALLFMLEEEKLARDTYIYLNNLWSINQFANIKNSEQTHMNAIENLLKQYTIEYEILPTGEFANKELQSLYDQFIIDGATSDVNALKIGATIEDLDIVDLQVYIDASSNERIISVFESLKCGSRNHLRSFVTAIEKNGSSYTPQFLSQEAYTSIIIANKEKCN